MPRTSHKKRLLNPNKSQLLFKEAPINGPKHEYGPQLRSAINPRSFLSEKQRQAAAQCTSWVSPQFNSRETTSVGQGKRNNQMATRISKKKSVLCLPQTRRTTACKYTPLSFDATAGQRCENLRSSRTKNRKELRETPKRTQFPRKAVERRMATSTTSRRKEVSKKLPLQNRNVVTKDSVHTPNTSFIPEPPNVETPEMPHCSSTSPSNIQHLLFSTNQAKTPPRTETANILVKDTPEKEYGLRVTWRRRKELMKLLMDRGQLLPTDAEVNNGWS